MTSSSTLSGRNVMSARGAGGAAPGRNRSSTPRVTTLNSSTASIMANPVPIQARGPAPKGM
jgi:hypothetical protein